jgi:hypothetical protein
MKQQNTFTRRQATAHKKSVTSTKVVIKAAVKAAITKVNKSIKPLRSHKKVADKQQKSIMSQVAKVTAALVAKQAVIVKTKAIQKKDVAVKSVARKQPVKPSTQSK